ncbi:polyprenyl synthetase family protein [Streptomyces sp. CB00455]|uniref:polyprenyl synthetase family protein n=1 Tax=Streptomyces sp. CB00455 TaxID=1703927 RepID=UPI00093F2024|nr:polyprenyl synthetase family protein [Streptomyces sp. CB00455]
MNAPAYLDLHRTLSEDIDAELTAALVRLGPASSAVRRAVAALLEHRTFRHPLSVLPLLVHGTETGEAAPAVPISAVHLLWWTSACYLDDLADGKGASGPAGLTGDEALLASVLTGTALPLQIIQAQPLPEQARGALLTELVNGWVLGIEGQIGDMRGDAGSATRGSVIETYRGKSGAPFGMITAMAAVFAGAPGGKVRLWREFGHVFGILWQLFNDQEDILSGRDEDLRNGTVTYLLAGALEDAAPGARARLLDLCAAARASRHARAELAHALREPVLLERYRADLGARRDEAHRILDDLGARGDYLPALRQLVDHSAGMLLTADIGAGLITTPAGARSRGAAARSGAAGVV